MIIITHNTTVRHDSPDKSPSSSLRPSSTPAPQIQAVTRPHPRTERSTKRSNFEFKRASQNWLLFLSVFTFTAILVFHQLSLKPIFKSNRRYYGRNGILQDRRSSYATG